MVSSLRLCDMIPSICDIFKTPCLMFFLNDFYRESIRSPSLSVQYSWKRRWEIESWSSCSNLKNCWRTRSESPFTVTFQEFIRVCYLWDTRVKLCGLLPNSSVISSPLLRRALQELTCPHLSGFSTASHGSPNMLLSSYWHAFLLTGWTWGGGEVMWRRCRIVSRDLWHHRSWGQSKPGAKALRAFWP